MLKKLVFLIILLVDLCFLSPPLQAAKDPLGAWKPKFNPNGAEYTYILSNISHPVIEGVAVGYRIRDRVWKETNGRLFVDYRPLAQLGGEKDVINKLKLGAVHGMLSSSIAATNIADTLNIVNLPYVVNTFDKVDTFRNTPELWQPFADSTLKSGIMTVDVTGYGPYGWATNTPVKTIADAKSINFRIAQATLNVDLYKAWGMKFTVMPWPDVPQALGTGVITGLDHTAIVCNITKKFTIAKNFTELDYAQGLFIHLMNKRWFDRLPTDLQKILITVIEEESAQTRELTRKQHADQVAKAKKAGVKFYNLATEDRNRLIRQSQAVYNKYRSKSRAAIGRDYLANVEAYFSQEDSKDSYVATGKEDRSQISTPMQQYPPDLMVSASFLEPSGNRILDAEETGQLVLVFENLGRGKAFNVEAQLTAQNRITGLNYPQKVFIGDLNAGQSKTKKIKLNASELLSDGDVRLRIDSLESRGFDPEPIKLVFECKALAPPRLILADLGINDQSGNARIEPKEFVELTLRVQNVGSGDARDTIATIKLGPNVYLAADSKSSFEIGALMPGEHRDISFSIYTNRRINVGEEIPVELKIDEARHRFAQTAKLDLKMEASLREIQQVVIESLPQPEHQTERIDSTRGLSVDVDHNIPAGQKAGDYDVAVIIGNRDYSAPNVPDVAFAIRDANVMRKYLIQTLGFKTENILFEENATLSKFNELFGNDRDHKGKLARFVHPERTSHVFIYYTGHGAPDLKTGDAYFVPADADPQYLSTNGYSIETLYKNLAKLPSETMTIVLDACFSGNSEQGPLFRGISPAMLKTNALAESPPQAVVFTSTSTGQVSAWYHEKKHSLFTYYFLKGLQGTADVDNNKSITVSEMETYLKEKVPYMAGRLRNINQDPSVSGDKASVLAILE